MIEKAKRLVENLMSGENSGHGMDHINRVTEMSLKFAEKENCDKSTVALIALLHDADDYKIFGDKNQEELKNTNYILNELQVDEKTKKSVLDNVAKIGYSKSLKGIRPTAIEGKIVSDADMCDALGASGLLRAHKYSLKHGKEFFDRNLWPIENISDTNYTRTAANSSVCHIFEKILKLKSLMLTESGKREADERQKFTVCFLRQLFKEEKAYDWERYLEKYLKNLD